MRYENKNNKKLLTISILAGLMMSVSACAKTATTSKEVTTVTTKEATTVTTKEATTEAPTEATTKSEPKTTTTAVIKPTETTKSSETKATESNRTGHMSAEEAFANMTLEEKIGQLFIVTPEQAGGYDDVTITVGGIIQMGGNVNSPEQIVDFNNELQNKSKYGLFIAVDEEGGRVARIGNNYNFDVPRYDSMLSIGNTGNTENARSVGRTIGAYIKRYGFNVDFAPDADVFTNPNNTVIGDRAFSTNPQVASSMVSACVDGFHESGIITSIKHFPGHGDTSEDTHLGTATMNKSWDELKSCELVPFINNLDKTDMIMISHITLPQVTSDGLPASLSRKIITKKLRGELGYSGIVITDALEMEAISNMYTSAQAAVKAFTAGADIILMPADINKAMSGIKTAVNNGEISEERLNESVMKILRLKEKYEIL